MKEGFAVAPGTEVIQVMVVRREADRRGADELAAIYLGEFDRAGFAGASGARDPARSLEMTEGAMLNLKGQAQTVSPIVLSGRSDQDV